METEESLDTWEEVSFVKSFFYYYHGNVEQKGCCHQRSCGKEWKLYSCVFIITKLTLKVYNYYVGIFWRRTKIGW